MSWVRVPPEAAHYTVYSTGGFYRYIIYMYMYSTDQRQGIMRLCFDRGSASLRTRSKRGANAVRTRRNRGLNEALPRSERGAAAVKLSSERV